MSDRTLARRAEQRSTMLGVWTAVLLGLARPQTRSVLNGGEEVG